MPLVRISDFREDYRKNNPGKTPPDARTLVKMIKSNKLYGFQICKGGTWWIDVDRNPVDKVENPLVLKVLYT